MEDFHWVLGLGHLTHIWLCFSQLDQVDDPGEVEGTGVLLRGAGCVPATRLMAAWLDYTPK